MSNMISPEKMRKLILCQSKRANVGHIGSCLCIVEILCALYGNVLRISSPTDPDRDRFILSKGHSALALYAALLLRRFIVDEDLNSFCANNTLFGVHPESEVNGIDFSSGSLGHGLSFGVGAALAARMSNSSRRVFCLISDAECNEGSVWEAAMFAAQHRLGRLTVIVDLNKQQAFGLTKDVLDLNLSQLWRAFGWETVSVDGHNVQALTQVLNSKRLSDECPLVILASTVFGRGVSFMEKGESITQSSLKTQPINWHYLPMSDEEFKIALSQVEADG
jgi:transketolase